MEVKLSKAVNSEKVVSVLQNRQIMFYLIAMLLVVQKKEKQCNISLNAQVCQSRKCFRCEGKNENENDLSLFLISELPWYHSKKEVRGKSVKQDVMPTGKMQGSGKIIESIHYMEERDLKLAMPVTYPMNRI